MAFVTFVLVIILIGLALHHPAPRAWHVTVEPVEERGDGCSLLFFVVLAVLIVLALMG